MVQENEQAEKEEGREENRGASKEPKSKQRTEEQAARVGPEMN